MNTPRSPRLGEVEQAGEGGRRLDPLVLGGRHVRQRAQQQRAADAVADCVHLALTTGLFDGVQRRQRALEHVVLEGFARQLGPRVDPGNHEHGVALLHPPADQRIFRLQVHHIELVDPRRHHQQRAPVHLIGNRGVLDQLHEAVLEHHLAGRGRDVDAHLECARIGHARIQPPAAALHVLQHVPQAVQQVLSARFHRGAQHFRIGGDEVRRRQRIGELARVERQLAACGRIEVAHASDLFQQPLTGQQIALAYQVEGRQLPVGAAKPAIRHSAGG